MILEHQARIRTTPAAVFDFFRHMDTNYRAWHPDHLWFRWISAPRLAEDVVFEFEEHIAGKRLRKRVAFTRVEPGRHLEFAPTSRLFRLVLPRIAFAIETIGAECVVRQTIQVRTGPVGAWLNRREFAAVRQHMAEEGANMKRLLERAG